MHPFVRHLVTRVVVPRGALAVLGAGSVGSASAQSMTCPRLSCMPPQPINISFQQLIGNGGFENGIAGWASDKGGAVSTTRAHCGSSSLSLRSSDTGSNGWYPQYWAGTVTQDFTIPQGSSGVSLDMWIFLPPYSTNNESILYVLGATATGTFTAMAQYSNATTTPGAWRHVGPIDLTAYQGSLFYLMLQGVTPTAASTPIYVDDVSVRTGLQPINTIIAC
jgi:hypothetical protein